ncbi:MAG: hypothetical protein A2848_02235 [Candidatus Magasanikbacteria bacterium RIFCSPHIGHO2_01_FULL_50_8]|uniref:EfeO-type cupredoxin-like domain-containing protein n=2 Tax=Candidatus Magasanikiibacteriota TaxID=1752731 RepID=A0A1F6LP23_9BACT|nr:MAG: hypothetical protein A2848_02235 [Candidatus Magasanikbacteria bacterium RIFCSPHIGHO2_01_FULL_50_8]OGH67706.1 MAG: hypothetical protein A3C15_01525 [Candidatus Magasanikbacteria bacterium RIFCSPHIGHO2_02_FULL_50_9b]
MKYKTLKLAALTAAFIILGAGCSSTQTPAPPAATGPQPTTVAITLNPQGLDKKEVTIKVGDLVEFRNSDLKAHSPASDPHPSHTAYPEFDAKGGLKPGDTWTFKFEKAGTWKFHDHAAAKDKKFQGVVIVK